jgi:uncharacterized protein (DUF2141 family)
MPLYRMSAIAVALGLLAAAPCRAADLELTIANLPQESGKVFVAVFNSAETFLKDDQRVAAVMLPARGGKARLVLDLPEGSYAVTAFQDSNGNGKLDTNILGIPTEGYGFSRDARGAMGPPSFASAVFELPAAGTRQTVKLSN